MDDPLLEPKRRGPQILLDNAAIRVIDFLAEAEG
jgi:hypothetical protein